MLKLIRAAACCKAAELKGRYIAKAEVSVHGSVMNVSARVMQSRKRLAIVRAEGDGGMLTLYLMPRSGENVSAAAGIPKDCTQLVITREAIDEYLTVSGDTNPIHRGERPVVPGLMLLLRLLPRQNVSAEARFYAPSYAGETLYVKRDEGSISVYSDHKIILNIREKL